MLTIQNYVRAQSLEQAYELCQKKANRVIGGMLWLRMSDLNIATAIDLSGLGLDQIEETPDSYRIGAMVTLRALETHPGLNDLTQSALACALRDIVGVQFRNMATVGGSVWGRFGFSDVLTVLMAMNASVELYHCGVIPLHDFAAMPPVRDILVRVIVPRTPGRYAYQAVRAARTDFPTLTCAAAVTADGVRLAVGARPGRAMLIDDAAGLPSGGMTPETILAFARNAAASVPTGSNSMAGAEYRTRLVRVLIARTLMLTGGDAHEA